MSVINQLQNNSKRRDMLVKAALLLVFIGIYSTNLQLDLSPDELYSLNHFQLVSLKTTFTDYHRPNNHIGFNLLMNVYLKLIGQRDEWTLLQHPEWLRIVPLIIGCGVILLLQTVAKRLLGLHLAVFCVLFFITTIPEYNFMLQLRGYGLSMLLELFVFYQLLLAKESGKKIHFLLSALAAVYLLLVIPSNVYFIFSLVFAAAFFIESDRRFFIQMLAWSAVCLIAGLLLYLPVLPTLLQFQHNAKTLVVYPPWRIFPVNLYHLISGRWPVLLVVFVGVLLGFRNKKANALLLLALLFVSPYVLSLLLADNAPFRVFVPGSIFFVLVVGAALSAIFEMINIWQRNLLLAAIFLICIIIFPAQLQKRNKGIEKDITECKMREDLFYNAYTHDYHPIIIPKIIMHASGKMPVVCYDHSSLPAYLFAAQLPYYPITKLDSLYASGKPFLVVTSFVRQLALKFPDRQNFVLNRQPDFANIVLIAGKN